MAVWREIAFLSTHVIEEVERLMDSTRSRGYLAAFIAGIAAVVFLAGIGLFGRHFNIFIVIAGIILFAIGLLVQRPRRT